MEIEVKYALPSEDLIEAIWNDEELSAMTENGTSEILPFHAVYYDTEDRVLRAAKLTLRVRSEGDTAFATMKWGGSSRKGLHRRQEVNVPLSAELADCPPSPALFAGTEKGEELSALCEGRQLVPAVDMQFTRRRRRICYEGNVLELALDCGVMTGPKGVLPILEMELEHYEGPDPKSVKKLGDELAAKYGLIPENRSKYSRGLTLT